MSTPDPVFYRAATRDDLPFILAHWVDSYARGTPAVARRPLTIMRRHYRSAVRSTVTDILAKPTTRVVMASCRLDPNIIYGFACYDVAEDFPILHYCYCKELFRGMDIGSTLVQLARDGKPGILRYTFHTKAAKRFLPGALLEPQLVTRAGRPAAP